MSTDVAGDGERGSARQAELEAQVRTLTARVEALEASLVELTRRVARILQATTGQNLREPPRGPDHYGDRFLAVWVNGRLFAVPLECVQEIVRMPALHPIPDASFAVAGLLDLRGEPVEVVDLRIAFGHEPLLDDLDCRIIVVELDDRTYGLKVDEVSSVGRIDLEQVDPALELTTSNCLLGAAPLLGDRQELALLIDPLEVFASLARNEPLALRIADEAPEKEPDDLASTGRGERA